MPMHTNMHTRALEKGDREHRTRITVHDNKRVMQIPVQVKWQFT